MEIAALISLSCWQDQTTANACWVLIGYQALFWYSQPCEVNAINSPISQIWKQTLREMKSFAWGHTTNERQNWGSNSRISPPEAVFLTTLDILAINRLWGLFLMQHFIWKKFSNKQKRQRNFGVNTHVPSAYGQPIPCYYTCSALQLFIYLYFYSSFSLPYYYLSYYFLCISKLFEASIHFTLDILLRMSLARVQYVFTVLFLLYELSHTILITSLPGSIIGTHLIKWGYWGRELCRELPKTPA